MTAERVMSECTECKYLFLENTYHNQKILVCRRYPPGAEGFPEVENDWSCGEFLQDGEDAR